MNFMIECCMVSLHIYEFMIIDCVHLWHQKIKEIYSRKVNNFFWKTRGYWYFYPEARKIFITYRHRCVHNWLNIYQYGIKIWPVDIFGAIKKSKDIKVCLRYVLGRKVSSRHSFVDVSDFRMFWWLLIERM